MTKRVCIARLTLLRWFILIFLLCALPHVTVGQGGTSEKLGSFQTCLPFKTISPEYGAKTNVGTGGGRVEVAPHTSRSGHPKVERSSKQPEAAKIHVNLLRLEEQVRSEDVSLAEAAAHMGLVTVGSGVLLDILTSHLDPSVAQKFERPGVTVRHVSTKYQRVAVVIDDLALLYELAQIPEVRMISPEYGAKTNIGTGGGRAKRAPNAGWARHPKVERYSQGPEAAKIHVNLLRLEEQVRTKAVSLAEAAATMGIVTVDSGVLLDILTSHLDSSAARKFERPGVTVRHVSTKYQRVAVVIDDLALLYELAQIPEVRTILPEYGSRTNVGTVGGRSKARSRRGLPRLRPSTTK